MGNYVWQRKLDDFELKLSTLDDVRCKVLAKEFWRFHTRHWLFHVLLVSFCSAAHAALDIIRYCFVEVKDKEVSSQEISQWGRGQAPELLVKD